MTTWLKLLVAAVLATLAGCGGYFGHEERAAWRGDAERRCFAAGLIQKSDFMVVAREVDGPGTCGMDRPIYITAVAQGSVTMMPQATLAAVGAVNGSIFLLTHRYRRPVR